jgi:uncharacterized protein YjbI with pentapeptide repeats
LQRADLEHAIFNGASLNGARLQHVKLYLTDFRGADLSNTIFGTEYPSIGNLPIAKLRNTDLSGSDLISRAVGDMQHPPLGENEPSPWVLSGWVLSETELQQSNDYLGAWRTSRRDIFLHSRARYLADEVAVRSLATAQGIASTAAFFAGNGLPHVACRLLANIDGGWHGLTEESVRFLRRETETRCPPPPPPTERSR